MEWVQANCHDPDVQLAKWLRDGFPIGIDVPITPGGLFPLSRSHAEAETLDGLLWNKGNHPSFSVVNDGDDLPQGQGFVANIISKVSCRDMPRERKQRQFMGKSLSPLWAT